MIGSELVTQDKKMLRCHLPRVVYLRNLKQFRGGLVFKVHRLLYHSTLGLRVIKETKKEDSREEGRALDESKL